VLAAAAALLALTAPGAGAAGTWVVKGAGYGHGVGMSQYGAYGYAKNGFDYQTILTHYYTGTIIGAAPPTQTVRVLLLQAPSIRFSGANSACGVDLTESKTYTAKRKGSKVLLSTKAGGRVASCGSLLSAAGGFTIELFGKGSYRGAIEIRPSKSGGLSAINAVDLESYVRGVVPRESPPSWPLEALKAQAVAARSYAIASPVRGAGFDQYADTRSQVYGGARAETTRTNQAAAETAGQVLTYQGKVAQTFFFSTSGGYTENNENSFTGGTPEPYLRGVPDPYEAQANSPYESWVRKFSNSSMQSKLGNLLKGKLRNIVVTRRGVSPRIVSARVVGTGGGTNVTGEELKGALGLPDTWAYFTRSRSAYRGSLTARIGSA
jgi:stage II sporulation protein D